MKEPYKPSYLYHCHCGCVYESSGDLKRFTKRQEGGGRISQLRCKEHFSSEKGNYIKSNICKKCGERFNMKLGTNTSTVCYDCADLPARASAMKYYNKNREEANAIKAKTEPKAEPTPILFKKIKEPVRALSVAQANNRGVACIPLDKLFRLHNRMLTGFNY